MLVHLQTSGGGAATRVAHAPGDDENGRQGAGLLGRLCNGRHCGKKRVGPIGAGVRFNQRRAAGPSFPLPSPAPGSRTQVGRRLGHKRDEKDGQDKEEKVLGTPAQADRRVQDRAEDQVGKKRPRKLHQCLGEEVGAHCAHAETGEKQGKVGERSDTMRSKYRIAP